LAEIQIFRYRSCQSNFEPRVKPRNLQKRLPRHCLLKGNWLDSPRSHDKCSTEVHHPRRESPIEDHPGVPVRLPDRLMYNQPSPKRFVESHTCPPLIRCTNHLLE